MKSKTPEQMAEEWVVSDMAQSLASTYERAAQTFLGQQNIFQSHLAGQNTGYKNGFLAGYKAAQEHAHAALEGAEATIAELSDDFEGMRSLWLDAQELAIELQAQLDGKDENP